jgi:hypothetical protein
MAEPQAPQAKQAHTATVSYASHWGRREKIRFESEKSGDQLNCMQMIQKTPISF